MAVLPLSHRHSGLTVSCSLWPQTSVKQLRCRWHTSRCSCWAMTDPSLRVYAHAHPYIYYACMVSSEQCSQRDDSSSSIQWMSLQTLRYIHLRCTDTDSCSQELLSLSVSHRLVPQGALKSTSTARDRLDNNRLPHTASYSCWNLSPRELLNNAV